MKCSMCESVAESIVSWPASEPQRHAVCGVCGHTIWATLSEKFSGTAAYAGFTIQPIYGEETPWHPPQN